jgi:hypothetical protein
MRLGSAYFSVPQLKVLQEVVTMVVFAGFCFFYLKQPLSCDYLWAALCLVGAAFFMFRHLAGLGDRPAFSDRQEGMASAQVNSRQ